MADSDATRDDDQPWPELVIKIKLGGVPVASVSAEGATDAAALASWLESSAELRAVVAAASQAWAAPP